MARSELHQADWTWLVDAYQALLEVNTRILSADQDGVVALADHDHDYLSGVRSSLEEALEKMREAALLSDGAPRPTASAARLKLAIGGGALALTLVAVAAFVVGSAASDRIHGRMLLNTSGVRALPHTCRAAAVPLLDGSLDDDALKGAFVEFDIDPSECGGRSWKVQLRRDTIVGIQWP